MATLSPRKNDTNASLRLERRRPRRRLRPRLCPRLERRRLIPVQAQPRAALCPIAVTSSEKHCKDRPKIDNVPKSAPIHRKFLIVP